MSKILLVDDDPLVLKATARAVSRLCPECEIVTSTAPLAAAKELDLDLVISDYNMPVMDGLELIATLRATNPGMVGVIFTGNKRGIPQDTHSAAADFVFSKPDYEELVKVVEAVRMDDYGIVYVTLVHSGFQRSVVYAGKDSAEARTRGLELVDRGSINRVTIQSWVDGEHLHTREVRNRGS